jgi:hypothetical protein
MPQNSIKNYFLVLLDYFSYKDEPSDLVRGLISSIDIEKYIPPNYRPLNNFLGLFEGSPKHPKQHKKSISWLFWTISLTRISLMIRLGAYFQA